MKVSIEKKNYTLLIDTGSYCPIFLQKNCIDHIENKTYLEKVDFWNFRGETFSTNVFRIPEVEIAKDLTIGNVALREELIEYTKSAVIWPHVDGPQVRNRAKLALKTIDGGMGWPILLKCSCLFDFSRSALYFAERFDCLAKLKKYPLEEFVKIPFSLGECGAVLTLETDLGTKRFLLDTGATFSVLRESSAPEELAEELETGKWFYKNRNLSHENHNFGPVDFALTDLADAFEVDGVLGIDFFNRHAICFDIEQRTAYILPEEKGPGVFERFLCWADAIFRSYLT